MRTGNRPLRIASLLKRELAEILRHPPAELAAYFFTVTEVRLSNDLKSAKVWVSVMGDRERRADAFSALQEAGSSLRKTISQSVRLKRMPELIFELDESLDYAEKIDGILRREGLLSD